MFFFLNHLFLFLLLGREKEYLLAAQNPEETRAWMEAIQAMQTQNVRHEDLFDETLSTHLPLSTETQGWLAGLWTRQEASMVPLPEINPLLVLKGTGMLWFVCFSLINIVSFSFKGSKW